MLRLPKRITVVGVGLIGGSIALGLKMHLASKISILGLCNDPERAKLAQKEGIIDQAIFNLAQIPRIDNLIILATPISTIIKILPALAKLRLKECLTIDVGSTKREIVNFAAVNFPSFPFVGTHPMAGKEYSGFKNADPFLFKNKPWIVCPVDNIKSTHLEIVNWLINILGAKKIIMSAKKHDQVLAFASHLWLILSSISVSIAAKQPQWKIIAQVASTGFRDITRLASHSPEMKTDIIFSSKNNIISVLQETKEEIDNFLDILTKNDANKLLTYLRESKIIRDYWLAKHFG